MVFIPKKFIRQLNIFLTIKLSFGLLQTRKEVMCNFFILLINFMKKYLHLSAKAFLH